MLKSILFDLDGTLINSEHFYLDCWNEILTEWGDPLTLKDWVNNYAGNPIYKNAQRLIGIYGITTPFDELIARREKLTVGRFKTTDVTLMPYALETLQFFAEKGLTMAIVTSSLRQDVDAIFERNGLKHYFKFIITRSDITKGKPHPEGYQLCCRLLGIKKDECVVFEDTETGLTAAKAAGLICYAVQSNTDEHARLTAADNLFLDLKEAKDYLVNTKEL